MRKDLYWLNGPWQGKLAMAARPRGGDWLEDDLSSWKREGVDTVLSLLTPRRRRIWISDRRLAKLSD